MSKHEKLSKDRQYEKIKNLKVKNGCFQNLKTKDLNSTNAEILNSNVQNSNVQNLNVQNLNVQNINGKKINCNNFLINFSANIDTNFPPINNDNFNSIVWDGLINESIFTLNDILIPNLSCGRFRNYLINNFYCPQPNCLPNDYSGCIGTGYYQVNGEINGDILTIDTELNEFNSYSVIGRKVKQNTIIKEKITANTYRVSISQNLSFRNLLIISNCPETDCQNVSMEIYGTYTIPIAKWDNVCHSSQVASSISYNLDVINRSINLSERAVAVLIQIAWIDPTTEILNIRQIDLSIKQFKPSLAAVLGENMSSNILLPTELIKSIDNLISNTYREAAIQLVVFIEDGIEVFTPPTPRDLQQIIGNVSGAYSPNDNKYIVITSASNSISVENEFSLLGVENITVTENIKGLNITCYGGGGGGGRNGNLSYSGSSLVAIYPGGGGGSGCISNGIASIIPGTYRLNYSLGRGGKGGTRFFNIDAKNGETTSCSLADNNNNIVFKLQAEGGNAGGFPTDRVFWNQSGDGGNGNSGGGGGGVNFQAGTNPRVGNAGAGNNCISGNNTSQDGQPGNSFTGGDGGFDNFGPGGKGGFVPAFDGTSSNIKNCGGGGGGGGGFGGGNGGFGDGSVIVEDSDSTLNGADAKPDSSSGGGGAGASLSTNIKGGEGGGGYIVIKFI
jgi:hypothetical protein